MKKPKNISAQDQVLIDRINALVDDSDMSPLDLAAELKQFGIDPDDLRQTAAQRIRAFATQKYSSLGLHLPVRMGEALNQMRPLTPKEQESALSARAKSRMQDILSSLRSGSDTFIAPSKLAPAFRNKKDDITEADKRLLERQQRDLDNEGEQ